MKTPESRVTAGRISSAVLFRFRFHAEKRIFRRTDKEPDKDIFQSRQCGNGFSALQSDWR